MSYSLLRDLLRRQDTTAQAIREVILDHILKDVAEKSGKIRVKEEQVLPESQYYNVMVVID
jgi:hypothetical protein